MDSDQAGWWGGPLLARRAAVKHLWELEAWGCPCGEEQAMPTSWPLIWRVHS